MFVQSVRTVITTFVSVMVQSFACIIVLTMFIKLGNHIVAMHVILIQMIHVISTLFVLF